MGGVGFAFGPEPIVAGAGVHVKAVSISEAEFVHVRVPDPAKGSDIEGKPVVHPPEV